MKTLEEFQKRIGYKFNRFQYLKEALTHRSYSFEKKTEGSDNQRLEFFGDAVLELIASEYLFNMYEDASEGELTKMRSAMTRGDALFVLAGKLDLDDYMFLGKGERSLEGKNQETRVIDAFEALVAAIYLDGGLDPARKFYLELVEQCWSNPYELMLKQNPKGSLQELTQKVYGVRPDYKLHHVSGQEHSPTYEINVLVKGDVIGRGTAGSRKKAEEEAARKAYDFLVLSEKGIEKSS